MSTPSSVLIVACIAGLIGLVVAVLVLKRSWQENDYLPPGEFIKLSDTHLHYIKKGQGGPTVIFESGLDFAGHLPWQKVQNAVSQFTTTVTYDRAGILFSSPHKETLISCKSMAQDLHGLIQGLDLPKPYVLVGHSLAGLHLRHYAQDYPTDLAGLILVDASHPQQIQRFAEVGAPPPKALPMTLLKMLNATGLFNYIYQGNYPSGPLGDEVRRKLKLLAHKSFNGAFAELERLPNLLSEANQIQSLGDIPLIVVTGASEKRNQTAASKALQLKLNRVWQSLQQELVNLSSVSRHIISDRSGHYIQLEQPEVVIAAVKALISTASVDD